LTTTLLVKIAGRLARTPRPAAAGRRSGGLAFVELVISALVLGWVLLSVYPLFLSSVRSNVAARSYAEVNALARDRLEGLRELPFSDPALSAGRHAVNDLPDTLPDPETGTFGSGAKNPFLRTYRVQQFQLPAAATVPRGAPFPSVRVTDAGLRIDFKRIEVTVEPATSGPGLGLLAARVSALVRNPAPDVDLSDADPDP
jgi:Tfp pilus assembly protein PilV